MDEGAFTQDLNAAQAEAVRHVDGPLLILAGAGSGKTRVITARIAELLRRGVPPYRVLAVTFTNKAAAEMRERVERLVGDGARQLWMGTFHSVCARLLRVHAERAGLTRDFVIFDDSDQKSLITRVMKEVGITDRYVTPRGMLSGIDQAKNRGEGPEEYEGQDYFTDLVARVYPVYQARLQAQNAVDFGDLLLKVLRLCERDPEVGEQLATKFQHVLVDEFQDTNRVQYRLVRHFAASTGNLCVVGDDDQSIYGWRGADVRNILDFEHDHPGTMTVKLERNYRSTQKILDAANAVVAKNSQRKDKRLYTEHAGGDDILYHTADDDRAEAEFVVRSVARLIRDEGRFPEDFAVLYRTHAQSRALEEAFGSADMPCTIIGGTRFYDRAEVKDAIAYLRLIQNSADEVSLERVINRPTRGIGDTTYEKIVATARALGVTVWEALRLTELAPATRKKVLGFAALIDELRGMQDDGIAALTERMLERTGYLERLAAERTHESEDRSENLMELLSSMKDYESEADRLFGEAPTLATYLERVALISSVDNRARGTSLMTVHASKGLEFPVVFVVGLEDGVFPSMRDGEDAEAIEEERRLAYVAITRARERLLLTNARYRRQYGQGGRPFRESRFLDDIPEHCIARPVAQKPRAFAWQPEYQRARAPRPAQRVEHHGEGVSVEYEHSSDDGAEFVQQDSDGFFLGQRVRHAQFGEGEVRGFTGSGRDLKLTVYFSRIGAKTIIARFVEVL